MRSGSERLSGAGDWRALVAGAVLQHPTAVPLLLRPLLTDRVGNVLSASTMRFGATVQRREQPTLWRSKALKPNGTRLGANARSPPSTSP